LLLGVISPLAANDLCMVGTKCLCVHPDGQTIYSVDHHSKITRWDAAGHRVATYLLTDNGLASAEGMSGEAVEDARENAPVNQLVNLLGAIY